MHTSLHFVTLTLWHAIILRHTGWSDSVAVDKRPEQRAPRRRTSSTTQSRLLEVWVSFWRRHAASCRRTMPLIQVRREGRGCDTGSRLVFSSQRGATFSERERPLYAKSCQQVRGGCLSQLRKLRSASSHVGFARTGTSRTISGHLFRRQHCWWHNLSHPTTPKRRQTHISVCFLELW